MTPRADRPSPKNEPLEPLRAVEKILEWRQRVPVITIDGETFTVPAGRIDWTLADLVAALREDGLDAYVTEDGTAWSYQPRCVQTFSIQVSK